MGTGLHPEMWQSCRAYRCSLPPSLPKVPGAWFGTNAHKHKHTWGTPSVRVHVWICVFPPPFALVDGGVGGWQVVDCAGVERAAMGISRFTTLVRKLTNQSCFSFRTDGVNRAPSCPSLTHSGPTDCAALLTSLVCLSLCSGPSCLVRGWKSILQKPTLNSQTYGGVYSLPKGKTNVLAVPNILYKIYSILFWIRMSLCCLTWHHGVADSLLWFTPASCLLPVWLI